MADKTEQPTARRLRKARETGDSPVSAAFGQAVGFGGALLLVPAVAAATASVTANLYEAALEGRSPGELASRATLDVLYLSTPIAVAAAGAALLLGLAQTGGALSGSRVAPRLDRLDPIQGLGSLFRLERLFALARALVAATAVAVAAWLLFREHAADLASSTGNAFAVAPLFGVVGKKLAWTAALVGLALGALDLLVVFRAWRERNRMTKDEVRREHREAEGDPELRARRRRAHEEALAGSLLNAVKQATVVVINPTHLASALRYRDDEDEAPLVVAQGKGELARHIVEAARAYGIPCVEDVPLAHALAELETGDQIPEALYEAVAEILREALEQQQASDAASGALRE